MLKLVLDNLDGIPESLRQFYEEKNGRFFLKVEDTAETAALKRAKDRANEEARQAKEAAAEAQIKLDESAAEVTRLNEQLTGGKKRPDELQAAYDRKEADLKKKHGEEVKKKDDFIGNLLKEKAAGQIAEIFTVPSVGKKLIMERLEVDFSGEEPTVRVLDAALAKSAMSVEDLKKEFVDNKELAPMLVGSKASGGGANGTQGGKPGSTGGKQPHLMTSLERADWLKRDPVGFKAAQARGEFLAPPPKAA